MFSSTFTPIFDSKIQITIKLHTPPLVFSLLKYSPSISFFKSQFLFYNKNMIETAMLVPALNGIRTLLSLVTKQIDNPIKPAWVFKEDLKKLRKRLEIIQALLYDAGKKKITSQTMMLWLKDLKAATCNAENVLDELAYEDLRRKVQNRMGNKHVKDKEEARKAQILEKSDIQELHLHWDKNLEESNNNHGDVLEGLKPHRNIKGLILEYFGGRRWVSWMSRDAHSLKKLVRIELRYCSCEQVPSLGHLPHLAIVIMDGLHKLKHIGPEFYGRNKWISDNCGSSEAAAPGVFPALSELTLVNMPQLEEWSDVSSLLAFSTSMKDSFPRLEDVYIEKCPKLTTIPEAAFKGSTSLQKLTIQSCPELTCLPEGVLQPTLVNIYIRWCPKLKMPATFNGLTSLQRFCITDFPELMGLPKGLLQPTLQYLNLIECPKLKTPNPDTLRSLTALKDLRIISSPNWGSCWEEGLFCTTSLLTLCIGGFGEEYRYFPWPSTSAASPPSTHFTSLDYLTLWGWPEVKSLPDHLEHLPALIVLEIHQFSGLESLPEWLGNLSSLKILNIFECPLLVKRCEKGTGEDWHKIAHIPSIRIDNTQIQ